MNRAEKEEWVEKFREDFKNAQSIILTNHSGIGVNTVNELRSEFRANGVHYHVVKNTLARMAVEGTDVEDLQDEFGMSYLFISHDMAVIHHVCDRVVFIPAALRRSPALADLFGGCDAGMGKSIVSAGGRFCAAIR